MTEVLVGGSKPYVPGSRAVPCSKCKKTVYISPSAQGWLEGDNTMTVLCAECTLEMIK